MQFELLLGDKTAKRESKNFSNQIPIILLGGVINHAFDCERLISAYLEAGYDVSRYGHLNYSKELHNLKAGSIFLADMSAFLTSLLEEYFEILAKDYSSILLNYTSSEHKSLPPSDKLKFNIAGYSIGGAFAEQLGCALRAFIKKQHPSLENKIEINVVIFDGPSTQALKAEFEDKSFDVILNVRKKTCEILNSAAELAGLRPVASEEIIRLHELSKSKHAKIIAFSIVYKNMISDEKNIAKFMAMVNDINHHRSLIVQSKFKPADAGDKVDNLFGISTKETREVLNSAAELAGLQPITSEEIEEIIKLHEAFKSKKTEAIVFSILYENMTSDEKKIAKFMTMANVINHHRCLITESEFKSTDADKVDNLLSISTKGTREEYCYQDQDDQRRAIAKNFLDEKLPDVLLAGRVNHISLVTVFAPQIAQASIHFFEGHNGLITKTFYPQAPVDREERKEAKIAPARVIILRNMPRLPREGGRDGFRFAFSGFRTPPIVAKIDETDKSIQSLPSDTGTDVSVLGENPLRVR